MKARVLLVEDDDALRKVLAFNLTDGGFDVDAVATGQAALETYDRTRHAAVLTDLRMPGLSGLDLLRRLKEDDADVVLLVMTAYGSLDVAVEAMQEGAFHYVEKPVNTRTLLAVLQRAVEHGRLGREHRELLEGPGARSSERLIVSTSPAMNELLRLVDKVAESNATILVQGESGTGKELIARAAHARSDRSRRPFVTVNCAAVPAELLESLLFGHEKGAFTGATKATRGKFSAADGGTLFLDEIGEMSGRLQSKLLRVLQDGEIDVVGANRPVTVDVRVIAATHRDLQALVEAGTFRHDLYYRLAVIPLTVPPLRARREDIPVLFRHFLRKHQPEHQIAVDRALLAYDWPGNVRELENLAKRMELLAEGPHLTIADVPPAIRAAGEPAARRHGELGELPFRLPEGGLDLVDLERRVIAAVLVREGGNQSAAARYLNIPRHILLYRMEKYGLK
jgi:DNA-binding NtrC family response regulator